MIGIAWHSANRAANAVWVHAHPGFKSPSLRSLTRAFSGIADLGESPGFVFWGRYAHASAGSAALTAAMSALMAVAVAALRWRSQA
jgi:hypothetical protein